MDTKIIDITAGPVAGTVNQVEVSAAQSIIEVSAGTTQTDLSVNHAGAGEQLVDIQVVYTGLGEESLPNDGLFRRNQDYASFQEALIFLLVINRYLQENLNSTELVKFSVESVALDTVSFQEAVSMSQGRQIAEVFNAFESVTTQANYFRSLVDNSVLADSQTLLVDKGIRDTLSSQERLAFAAEAVLEDTNTLLEYKALVFGKTLDPETFAVYDTAPVLTVDKVALDTSTSSDSAYFAVDLSLQDILYPTDDIFGEANIDDDQYATVGKNLIDSLGYSDSVDLLAEFYRTILDNVLSAEALVSDFGKNLDEPANTAETLYFGVEVSYADIAQAYDIEPILDTYKVILETQEPYASDVFGEDYLAKRLELAELVTFNIDANYPENNLSFIEYLAADVNTSLAETFLSSELVLFVLGRDLFDTLGYADTVDLLVDWNRLPVETSTTAESLVLDSAKNLLDSKELVELVSLGIAAVAYDIASSAESLAFEQMVKFIENLSVTDDVLGEANIDDDQYATVGKNLAESNTLLEAVILAVLWVREYEDTSTISDSTYFDYSLVYGESNYFNEGYVAGIDYVQQGITLLEQVSQEIASYKQDDFLTSEQLSFLLSLGAIIFESASLTEALAFDYGPALADTTALAEAAYLNVGKTATDNFGLLDTLVFLIQPNPRDTATTSESLVRDINTQLTDLVDATDDILGEANIDDDQYATVGKSVVDSSSTSELISWLVGWDRVFADSSATSEALYNAVNKVATDLTSTSEVLSFVNGFSRTLSETATSTELVNFALARNYSLVDSSTLAELVRLNPNKINLDTISSSEAVSFVAAWAKINTDTSTSTETLYRAVGKSIAETFSKSELVRLAPGLLKTDSTSTTDTNRVYKTIGLVKTESKSMSETKTAYMQSYFQSQYAQTGYVGTNYSL